MSQRVRVVRRSDRETLPGFQTPGIHREQAIATDQVWIGVVETEPSVFSDWHHHGEYDTFVYLTSGRARVEFGPAGHEHAEVSADEFLHIPKHTVHREGNPDATPARGVIVRIGSGQSLYNVDGPEPA